MIGVFQYDSLNPTHLIAPGDIPTHPSNDIDNFLFEVLDNSSQNIMRYWKKDFTVEDLQSRINKLGFNDVAQFKPLLAKIEKIESLSEEITTAYEDIQTKSGPKYTPEDIKRLAVAIIFEVPKHTGEGKIEIDLGRKKLQTLFYDPKTGDVYILHKERGKEFLGGFKVIKSVTEVNIQTLKAAQYVQLLTKKRKQGMLVPVERFKIAQEKLQKEMQFLEEHNVEGDFYLRPHKVISYSTKYGGQEMEKVTIMVPEYSGDASLVSGKCMLKESALIIRNTVFAVAGFHEKHLLHLDISPENLLLVENKDNVIEKCVLSDYALSCKVPNRVKKTVNRLYGKPHYAAPELLLKKHPHFISINRHCDFHTFEQFDSFATGATLYEVVFGRPFWDLQCDDNGFVTTPETVLKKNAQESFELLNKRIKKLEGLIGQKEEKGELADQESAEREFLRVIRSLLKSNPKERMSAIEAKKRILEIEEQYGKAVLYSFIE